MAVLTTGNNGDVKVTAETKGKSIRLYVECGNDGISAHIALDDALEFFTAAQAMTRARIEIVNG